MKKIILLAIAAVLNAAGLQAQAQTSQIKGLVKDDKHQPMESVTLSLLAAKDSAQLASTISDKSGQYSFQNVEKGKYLVRTSAVGFESSYSSMIWIRQEGQEQEVTTFELKSKATSLQSVAVTARKPYIEQKADKTIINVDASPSNTGSSVMDVLEKSPGVMVDKDGNISLKGKQGVTIMIDGKPTYLTSDQLANYLKSMPSSAIDQLEIMTNPPAKYDASGNSGIINIKTKKNKAKGFNGNLSLTQTQGVYAKPGGSLNLNYRTGKFNFFLNGGYTYWQGFQELDLTRNYLDMDGKTVNSIFTQQTHMNFTNPEANLKLGADFYVSKKTTLGFVISGFSDLQNFHSNSHIALRDAAYNIDSTVFSPSTSTGYWKNGSINLNFRHQFDSAGRELTADLDYMKYGSLSDQYFDNYSYDPHGNLMGHTALSSHLPSYLDIYSIKSDYTHPFQKGLKLEAGVKSSYVSTDNQANYYNILSGGPQPDTSKTNRFLYRENINAAYLNFSKQWKKWSAQAGLRLENTNYSGHQLGNPYTVNNNDSSFTHSYVNLFPTAYISYQASANHQFTVNYGRRIDRPAYQDLNPFLFYLDQYTYQAGNPYLRPQYTHNIELSHTYKNFLTTTLNYSDTRDYMSETFEQLGHATIVRQGNIGRRQNAGLAVSANFPVVKWWTTSLYGNFSYNQYRGELYGQYLDVSAYIFQANVNNQFKFSHGWAAELSGFYQTRAIESQVIVQPLGQVSSGLSKQVLHEKGSLKLAFRDMFYTQVAHGYINFQQTQATFTNSRDSRQVSLTFTYRFGKPIQGQTPRRQTGGASEESSRVKSGSAN